VDVRASLLMDAALCKSGLTVISAEVQFGCDLAAAPACRNGQQGLWITGREIGVRTGNWNRGLSNSPGGSISPKCCCLEDILDSVDGE